MPQPTGQYPTGQYVGSEYFAGPDPRAGHGAPQGGPYPPGPPPGAPAGGWYAGGYPPPPGGPTDYLTGGYGAPPGQPRRRSRRMLWSIVASATAVLLTAGGVTAYTLLAGGGVTLDAQLPADSVAYAEINLDPPASQKVAALRFFHHFRDLNVREDAADLISGLVEPLLDTAEVRQQYDQNVKPWVGKHAAFGIDPQGDAVEPIAVVESTDPAKARAGLDALRRQAKDAADQVGYVVTDKFVVLARSEAVARNAISDAAKASLHGNNTFQQDLKSVGDDGVFTAWLDLGRSAKLGSLAGVPGADSADVSKVDLRGRVVVNLRFTDSTADLTMRAIGTGEAPTGDAVGPRLAKLPDDTAVAVALSGGDKLVRQTYKRLDEAGLHDQLTSLENDLGISLPDDLAALVGSTTVFAVGGSSDQPDFGVVARTDDADGAKRAAERLSAKLGLDAGITVRSGADGTVLASSSDYADKLTGAGGLGNSDLFRAALPDLDGAQFVIYVDLQRVAKLADEPVSAGRSELRAFGMTTSTQGDISTVHLRLVV